MKVIKYKVGDELILEPPCILLFEEPIIIGTGAIYECSTNVYGGKLEQYPDVCSCRIVYVMEKWPRFPNRNSLLKSMMLSNGIYLCSEAIQL